MRYARPKSESVSIKRRAGLSTLPCKYTGPVKSLPIGNAGAEYVSGDSSS